MEVFLDADFLCVESVDIAVAVQNLLPRPPSLLHLLDDVHLCLPAAAVVVDGLLPDVVLGAGDGGLAAEHGLRGQLLVLQHLVDDYLVAVLQVVDVGLVLEQLEHAPGQLGDRQREHARDLARDVHPGARQPLLGELSLHDGRVDEHVGLGHGLAGEGLHLAVVGAGHGDGGPVQQEGAVPGVLLLRGAVLQVYLPLEHGADDLGPAVPPPRDPDQEGGGVLVEVPLDLQLGRLRLVKVVIAVEDYIL